MDTISVHSIQPAPLTIMEQTTRVIKTYRGETAPKHNFFLWDKL